MQLHDQGEMAMCHGGLSDYGFIGGKFGHRILLKLCSLNSPPSISPMNSQVPPLANRPHSGRFCRKVYVRNTPRSSSIVTVSISPAHEATEPLIVSGCGPLQAHNKQAKPNSRIFTPHLPLSIENEYVEQV